MLVKAEDTWKVINVTSSVRISENGMWLSGEIRFLRLFKSIKFYFIFPKNKVQYVLNIIHHDMKVHFNFNFILEIKKYISALIKFII
jgi:hypothetical protein